MMFLPDYPDQVKAIAMRGLTDDEMAEMFGISPDLIDAWKKFYPSFAKAIDSGRTFADANVVKALYDNAIGFDYETDEVVKTRTGAHVVTVKKRSLGDTQAQKFWLENRQPEHWSRRLRVSHGGDGTPIGVAVKAETKVELINSILSLIKPADAEVVDGEYEEAP